MALLISADFLNLEILWKFHLLRFFEITCLKIINTHEENYTTTEF